MYKTILWAGKTTIIYVPNDLSCLAAEKTTTFQINLQDNSRNGSLPGQKSKIFLKHLVECFCLPKLYFQKSIFEVVFYHTFSHLLHFLSDNYIYLFSLSHTQFRLIKTRRVTKLYFLMGLIIATGLVPVQKINSFLEFFIFLEQHLSCLIKLRLLRIETNF